MTATSEHDVYKKRIKEYWVMELIIITTLALSLAYDFLCLGPWPNIAEKCLALQDTPITSLPFHVIFFLPLPAGIIFMSNTTGLIAYAVKKNAKRTAYYIASMVTHVLDMVLLALLGLELLNLNTMLAYVISITIFAFMMPMLILLLIITVKEQIQELRESDICDMSSDNA